MHQEIRYCTASDGTRLAYSVIGSGSPIVRVSQWMSHLEYELQSPVRLQLIQGLAHRHKVVRYDARGNGLSQRDVNDVSFDRWVEDLETIIEAVGVDRFVLIGMSQGAAIAIQYAVRHPDRVSHLILSGGFARGNLHRENADKEKQFLELSRALVREGWGSENEAYRQWYTSQFIPGGTAEDYHWFNELQRVSASPDMAERYLVEVANINVVDLLPQVKAPTLVLHATGDVRVPFALGQEIAARIPGARFVSLDSKNHQLLPTDPARRDFFDAITSFLGDPPIRGAVPGTRTVRQRLDDAVKGIEQNAFIKLSAIVAAIAGCVILLFEMWKLFR